MQDVRGFFDVVVVEQLLVGGEEFGRSGVCSCWQKSRLDGVEGLEVRHLHLHPVHLWIILMAYRNLPHPVFFTIRVEGRGDTPTLAAG